MIERSKMWFGTKGHMEWIKTPLSSADVSPAGYSANLDLLNGGELIRTSRASHRVFQFSWSNASARVEAQRMQNYYAGTFGRGLLYFIDPLTYGFNVLPPYVADPSMGNDYEGPQLVPNVDPTTIASPYALSGLPVNGAKYTIPTSFDNNNPVKFWVPIPIGFKLEVCAWFASTSTTAGVFCEQTDASGNSISTSLLANNTVTEVNTRGANIYVGRTGTAAADVSLYGITAVLVQETMDTPVVAWSGGMGHSGCRFSGAPTLVNYNGVNGGQVGFSAELVETGAWEA